VVYFMHRQLFMTLKVVGQTWNRLENREFYDHLLV
jgi:hypothetical protein